MSDRKKAHTFTRQELYDLVWSEPMRLLAGKYTISDRGLAKACAGANVPVPERGYWAKLAAGKKVFRTKLPPRGLGESDEVTIGRDPHGYYQESEQEILEMPIPQSPVFEEDIEAVRGRVIRLVSKAPLHKRMGDSPHHLIAKIVEGDKARSDKNQSSWGTTSWNTPVFNTPFETRRLNILNALFRCLSFLGMHPSISGREGRETSVVIGHTHVSFSLDAVGAEKQIERERNGWTFSARDAKAKIRLSLRHWRSHDANAKAWQDTDGGRIENHLRDIVVEIIVLGEHAYRAGQVWHREHLIERKARVEDQIRQRKIEEERKRREYEAKLEKLRVDHLLGLAESMDKAAQIRALVAAIQTANATAPEPMGSEEMTSWSQWALMQADRIDPVLSGRYKAKPTEAIEDRK